MDGKIYFEILTNELLKKDNILEKLTELGIEISLIQERKIGLLEEDFDLYEEAVRLYGESAISIFSNFSFIQDLCLLKGTYIIVPSESFLSFQKFTLENIKSLTFLTTDKRKPILHYKGRVVKRTGRGHG